MNDETVKLISNGLGAQVYLPRSLFRHSRSGLEPGDEAIPEVLEDGRIALGPEDDHDAPVDGTRRDVDGSTTGTRRETTGDDGSGGIDL